jgi:acetyl esterase/lipase
MTKFLTSDFLQGGERMDYLRTTFVGPHGTGAGELNRYISPASLHPSMQISFKGFPKTFIMAGGAEILLDQIKTLKDRMVKDLGESNVTYFEAKDGVHDYLAFKWHEPERGETLEAIAKWVYAG